MRDTFPGVSATMQVMAVTPYTPSAPNVFRSACAPAPALLSEPAIVSATAVAVLRERCCFLFAGITLRGQRPPYQPRRRRCRWPRPDSLPSLLYKELLPPAWSAVYRRRNDHRHRCGGNLQAQFPGKDRSRYIGHRRRTFLRRFRDIYLRRPPCSPPEMSSKVRKNQKPRNRFLFSCPAQPVFILSANDM